MSATPLRRDLAAFTGRTFDLAVIGGGIVGACIARDAARRGLSVALIDKGDFSSGTSAASSKLVHGGIRYLRSFELRLVREALRERRLWATNASHLVRPLPFLLPIGDSSAAALRAGVALYDLLAFDGNRIPDAEQRVPRHRFLQPREAERMEPALAGVAGNGAILYYDYQMESAERLGLECVMDAVSHGACAANYLAMTGFLRSGSGLLEGLAVKDALSGGGFEIRARSVMNATGPWADQVAAQALGAAAPFTLRRSKGIHLVCRNFLGPQALALTRKGRHLFALPWRGRSLIGTTDIPYDEEPGEVGVSEEEEADLLHSFSAMLPGGRVKPQDIVHRYAGVRPLIGRADGGKGTYALSRGAEIVEHGRSGGPPNLISAIGGKWTTARLIAEKAVDKVAARLGCALRPCDTASARLPLAPPGTVKEHEEEMGRRLSGLHEAAKAQLMRSYGTAAEDVVRTAQRNRNWLSPLAPNLPHITAEAAYARRNEMAVRVEDVLFRRTSIATLGGASAEVRRQVEQAFEESAPD
ncbi:MAG TPA: glycerol-3-phosphate dehydrogenase/oxidase [Allosphingosinicella sp.]|jgi:glycerol-3-phosphate dehydrogenase